MKRPFIYLVMTCLFASVSFGAFDYIATGYVDSTFPLNDQSLLVDGDGVKAINAEGASYIEVRNTLPLQLHGGIETINLYDTSSMKLYGGEVGTIHARYDTTKVYILGGEVSGTIYGYKESEIYVSAGTVNQIYLNGSSTATLTGGDIESIRVGYNFSPINPPSYIIVCDLDSLNFTYEGSLVTNVTGNWLDGSGFDIDFEEYSGIPVMDCVTFVPEPATMALMALGGILARKRR